MCKILNLRVLARCLSLVWGKKKKRASRQTFVGAVKTGFYVDAGPGLWSGVEAVQGLWNESLAWVALCQQSSSSLPPTLGWWSHPDPEAGEASVPPSLLQLQRLRRALLSAIGTQGPWAVLGPSPQVLTYCSCHLMQGVDCRKLGSVLTRCVGLRSWPSVSWP
jgi:hypothetical protein